MYLILFIHSSVFGHSGCFWVLNTVNSVAVNIGINVSFWIVIFSGYMPSRGISRSYRSFKCFQKHPYSSPQWLYQFTFPARCRTVPFSPTFTVCRFFFDGGRPGWWKVISHRSVLLWSVMLFVCLCCCLVTQLCSTFLGPHDCSPPDFSDGISQARLSEWVSISYFRGPSWLRNYTHFSWKSPALQVDSLPLSHRGSPVKVVCPFFDWVVFILIFFRS